MVIQDLFIRYDVTADKIIKHVVDDTIKGELGIYWKNSKFPITVDNVKDNFWAKENGIKKGMHWVGVGMNVWMGN